MSSNLEQSTNAQQGSSSSTNINSVAIAPPILNSQTSSSSNTEIPPNNEGGSSDLNTSIGSQRSLNSRIFPTSFRISRDIILNNVSHKLNVKFQVRKNLFLDFQCHVQVFQEIRPLVQNSSSANAPFTSWMRNSLQSVNTTTSNEEPPTVQDASTVTTATATDNSSVIINIGSPSTSYARQNSAPARTTTDAEAAFDVMGSNSANQSRTSLQNDSAINVGGEEANGGAGGDPNNDTLSQMPEARALINTISRYFPYVCILFAKSCYDHLDGILHVFALFIVFAHSNFTLKQEITKQAQRRFLFLIRELIYIILVITIIAFLLEKKENSTISLFFAPLNIPPEKKELSLKDLLFSVVITDLILKLVTVAIKIIFTMLPRRAVEFKNRVRMTHSQCAINNFIYLFEYFIFFLLLYRVVHTC